MLWFRAAITVSDVTVGAVFERVFSEAVKDHKFLDCFVVEEKQVNLEKCYGKLGHISREQIIEAFQFVITEFLVIIGNLTGEIISSNLHKTLLNCDDIGLQPLKKKEP